MIGDSNADVVNYVNTIYNKFAKPNYMTDEVIKACNTSNEFTLTAEEQAILVNVFNSVSIEISDTALTHSLAVNEYNWDVGRDPTFSGIIRENQILTISAGGGGSDSQSAKATIEDAIGSLTKYFTIPLTSSIRIAEEQIDAQLGTNSQQYADVNRKTTSSGGNNGNTGSSSTIYSPAPINNKSQYVDRTVKRYFFNIAETMLKQANASLKYYNNEV